MTMTTRENDIYKRMKEFTDERDAALLSLDKDKIVAHMKKWKIPFPDDDLVFWIAIHKARVALLTLPSEAVDFSLQWLKERNYAPEIVTNFEGRHSAIKIQKNELYGRIKGKTE